MGERGEGRTWGCGAVAEKQFSLPAEEGACGDNNVGAVSRQGEFGAPVARDADAVCRCAPVESGVQQSLKARFTRIPNARFSLQTFGDRAEQVGG